MASELILVVEDCPINLKLTRILLMNEGYEVLTADSGGQALELLRSHRPHLVLADIQMPGMDGLTLTRRIKQDEATRDIPVVALTALAMKGDKEKALEAGCDGYITKPIKIQEVRREIREFLDRRSGLNGQAAPQASGTPKPVPAHVLDDLRHRFREEGQAEAHQWLSDLGGCFRADTVAQRVHQWVGAGALLGYSGISSLARETETILRERPVDQGQLRECLEALCAEFDGQQGDCAIPGEAA
jgi:two-component system cell cycle response regulator DivK